MVSGEGVVVRMMVVVVRVLVVVVRVLVVGRGGCGKGDGGWEWWLW